MKTKHRYAISLLWEELNFPNDYKHTLITLMAKSKKEALRDAIKLINATTALVEIKSKHIQKIN
jgi:hypothetical protein